MTHDPTQPVAADQPRGSRTWRSLVLVLLPGLAALVLLLVLVLPALLSPHDESIFGTCPVNEKRLALSLLMCADKHGGRLPRADAWVRESFPFVGNRNIYVCSEEQGSDGSRPLLKDLLPDHPVDPYLLLSYSFNAHLSGMDLKSLPHPDQIPLLWDGMRLSGGCESALFRHKHGLNVAFCDGHVKWMKREQFLKLPLRPQ